MYLASSGHYESVSFYDGTGIRFTCRSCEFYTYRKPFHRLFPCDKKPSVVHCQPLLPVGHETVEDEYLGVALHLSGHKRMEYHAIRTDTHLYPWSRRIGRW